MRIPDDEEIFALHVRHAPTAEALAIVYTHSEIVRRIAMGLLAGLSPAADDTAADDTAADDTAEASSEGAGIDARLVRAGCLLHDVGVYRLYDEAGQLDHRNYMRHGVLGYELLQEEGLPEAICRFASHHTGTGLSREDVLRQELPLPPGDYLAETPEEVLVMYADKFHSKTTPPKLLTAHAYAVYVRRFGADKVAAFESMRAAFGEPDLSPFSTAYGHPVLEDVG